MSNLSGKVAIVSGASSGIGYSTARLFARQGARVIVIARRREKLGQLIEDIEGDGGVGLALTGDVRDENLHRESVEIAIAEFGGLDIAVNNAGTMGTLCKLPEMSVAQWREAIDTNLTSAFIAAKYQIPAMVTRGSGAMVFVSSFVGYTAGMPTMSAYAASKAGLIGLTQVLAVEYGTDKIRVNALLPGGTDTPMGREVNSSPEAIEFVKGLHALKRMATPDEIAKSALYLVSDASSFTTGTALLADGGVSINRV